MIDSLRMVRGNARDLTVPPADSEEFEFLARRLGYRSRMLKLQQDLESTMETVRDLSQILDRRWLYPGTREGN